MPNLLLEVGVSLLDGWKDLLSTDDVGLLWSQRLCLGRGHVLLLLRHHGLGNHWLLHRWLHWSGLLSIVVVLSLTSLLVWWAVSLGTSLVVGSRLISSVTVV